MKYSHYQYKLFRALIRSFNELMVKELAANYYKGGRAGKNSWLTLRDKQITSELYYHIGKLQQALKEKKFDQIKEYCADIAVMAMICTDIYCPLVPTPFYHNHSKEVIDWYFKENFSIINPDIKIVS